GRDRPTRRGSGPACERIRSATCAPFRCSDRRRARRLMFADLRDWRQTLWLWYIASAVALTAFYILVPPFKGSAAVINVLGLSSTIAIGVGIRIHRPKAQLAWGLLLAGQLL